MKLETKVPAKSTFNRNHFKCVCVCVCACCVRVCFQAALWFALPRRIRCWFWLVLRAVGRESWPTGCVRIWGNTLPTGQCRISQFENWHGLSRWVEPHWRLRLRPQNLPHHKGALLWRGEWRRLPFRQRGRVSAYDSHGALVFRFNLWSHWQET